MRQNLENLYKLTVAAPAIFALGAIVFYGLCIFALDKNNIRKS